MKPIDTLTSFSPHPSFFRVKKQIQITFSVDTYQSLISARRSVYPNEQPSPYWEGLPRYRIAVCPFCTAVYSSLVDTHSLAYWITSIDSGRNSSVENVFYHADHAARCRHFAGVQTFINLNGHLPTETTGLSNKSGDIPIVLPGLLESDTETLAVMHSLSICRIEDDAFVPRYSAYTVTYYSKNPLTVRGQVLDKKYAHVDFAQQDGYHPGYLYDDSSLIESKPAAGDYLYWIKKKKLMWLDLDDPELSLISSSVEKFPYKNVEGLGRGWRYLQRPKPKYRWQRRNWTPEGEII